MNNINAVNNKSLFKPGQVYSLEDKKTLEKRTFVIKGFQDVETFNDGETMETETVLVGLNPDGYEWSTFYPDYYAKFFNWELLAQYPTWQEAVKNNFKPNL
jgi:hypothetical protein